MKVAIKVIKIPVKVIKTGYVLLVDKYFGEVVLVEPHQVKVKYPDESDELVPIDIAKECVAKFLAQTDDLRTYPLIHEDFYKIMWQFDTREKCAKFLANKGTVEGTFKNIPVMPKCEDIVELINIDIAEKHKLDNKTKRIGTISKATGKYKYNVLFATATISLNRADFKIVGSENSKQVFCLKD